jgi:Vanadium chloroperoxidase N-terminal domain/PAP2 superfamily
MDSILYWNEVALDANRDSHTNPVKEQAGPPLSARALAIVHLAMYDAYAGTPGGDPLPPYLPGLGTADPGASVDAAIAAAAHATLSALFPSQTATFDARLAAAPVTGTPAARGAGGDFGRQVADAILQQREGDPGAGSAGYDPPDGRGGHRVDPDNPGQGYHAPFYGATTRCFAVTERFALDAPPKPGEPEYTAALSEVRGKGIDPELAGTLPSGFARRTPLETVQGIWWAYDGADKLGTPPRLYNQIIRQVADHKANTLAQNAQLFAMVNVAMADAGILAWEQKYAYELWRPVLGVREHDRSMGPEAVAGPTFSNNCDPGWLPLGAPATNSTRKNFTPPFPAYPSGHATFGAAAFGVTRLFYGVTSPGPDDLLDDISFVSEEFDGISTDNGGTVRPRHERLFPGGLWQMITENSLSRVYLGVHWSFDGFVRGTNGDVDLTENVGGVPLGLNIAGDIFANGLHPSQV